MLNGLSSERLEVGLTSKHGDMFTLAAKARSVNCLQYPEYVHAGESSQESIKEILVKLTARTGKPVPAEDVQSPGGMDVYTGFIVYTLSLIRKAPIRREERITLLYIIADHPTTVTSTSTDVTSHLSSASLTVP